MAGARVGMALAATAGDPPFVGLAAADDAPPVEEAPMLRIVQLARGLTGRIDCGWFHEIGYSRHKPV